MYSSALSIACRVARVERADAILEFIAGGIVGALAD
jgi:hypothetical protein